MIHWGWLIVAFYGGLFAGVGLLALCTAAKSADEQMDCFKCNLKKEETPC
jgi:hypothetical protein